MRNFSNITLSTAVCGGNIINDGKSTITNRGICWDTKENPSLDDNLGYTSEGTGIGEFASSMNGLSENTTYYVVAHATNERGSAYGEIKSFTTLEITLPEVITTVPTDIQVNSASSGGNILSNGNSVVTARGVCWNTSNEPSLENNIGYTNDGVGLGVFSSTITGLDIDSDYYLCAYTTNEKGTSYGEIIAFSTLNGFVGPRDGQVYQIVEIGSQIWMAENLNIGNMINASDEMQDNSIIEKYCYDDEESNCGMLFSGL